MSRFIVYLKLSLRNVLNNKRYFLPYALSLSLFAALIHILSTIKFNVEADPGKFASTSTSILLQFAIIIISIFAFTVSLSTNRFLRKSRRREHGLYSLLGMKKSHIATLSILESFITMIFSFIMSIVFAFVFSKLFNLVYFNLLNTPSENLDISINSIIFGFLLLTFIFLLNSFFNIFSSAFLNPIKTLRSASFAEREPKAKVIPALIGFIVLGLGYYLSLSASFVKATENNSLSANSITNFFWAVLAVIIGTYILMMLGFTVIIKMFKSNKKFFYKKNNFISLSSLMYRIRQNGMALGTIIILSCSVIVTMTMTTALYDRMNERIIGESDKDFRFQTHLNYIDKKVNKEQSLESIKDLDDYFLSSINSEAKEKNREIINLEKTISYGLSFEDLQNIKVDGESLNPEKIKSITRNPKDSSRLIPEEIFDNLEINLKFKTIDELNKNEIKGDVDSTLNDKSVYIVLGELITTQNQVDFKKLMLGDEEYEVSSILSSVGLGPTEIIIFFSDAEELEKTYFSIIQKQIDYERESGKNNNWSQEITTTYLFDLSKVDSKTDYSFVENLDLDFERSDINGADVSFSLYSLEDQKLDYFALFGTLLFIGTIISTAFLIATAMIMFYKFYSEGLDDRNRYKIMQNVGLSSKETKSAIKKQTIAIFSMPIIITLIHMFFASFGMNSIFSLLLGYVSVADVNLYLIVVCSVYLIIYFLFYIMGYRAYELGIKGK